MMPTEVMIKMEMLATGRPRMHVTTNGNWLSIAEMEVLQTVLAKCVQVARDWEAITSAKMAAAMVKEEKKK